MERQGTPLDWIAKTAVLLAMTLALPAHAQSTGSINDFQLPPGDAPRPPPVTGPVDAELPANGTSSAPVPPPAPQSPPTRAPMVTETAPPPIVIPIRPGEPATVTAPPRTAVRAPAPAAETAPGALPAPTPSGQAPVTVAPELPPAPSAVPAQTSTPTVEPVPARSSPWIWWLAGGALLGLLLAGSGFVLRRRRYSGDVGEEGWADVGPAETDDLPPFPATMPAPTLPTGSARPRDISPQVELAFEPRHLTMALINARLAYRLSLTNRADAAIGPVSIACDIISAHASLSHGEQLSFESGMVEPQHQLGSLDAGETVSLTGELQIPVAAILPIHSGDASLFVPLARFHITMLGGDRPPLVSTRIFVIGERPEQPWERLRPLRLDRGQRTFSSIGQREIVASA